MHCLIPWALKFKMWKTGVSSSQELWLIGYQIISGFPFGLVVGFRVWREEGEFRMFEMDSVFSHYLNTSSLLTILTSWYVWIKTLTSQLLVVFDHNIQNKLHDGSLSVFEYARIHCLSKSRVKNVNFLPHCLIHTFSRVWHQNTLLELILFTLFRGLSLTCN